MATLKGELLRHNVTVAFNDVTDEIQQGYIAYDPTSRRVYPGASLAGWSFSNDGGQSFKYMGKVRPPLGWKVLWGDPAITVSRTDQEYMFLSTLAVPDAKFPSVGYIDGSFAPPNQPSPLGGACILRSSDYGKTFTVSSQDCLTDSADFYDGGSMETDADGAVYASFVDYDKQAIHVWRAATPTSLFVRLPDPFAGKTGGAANDGIQSHPRLRFDIVTRRIYVMAIGKIKQDSEANPTLVGYSDLGENRRDYVGSLYIDWWDGTSWHGPFTVADDVLGYPAVAIDSQDPFGWIRTGPQFSFDIGDASVKGYDEVRIAYTKTKPNGDRGIQVLACQRDVAGCLSPSEWSTMVSPRSQWNPEVRTQLGWFGVPSVWKLAYSSTESESGNAHALDAGLARSDWFEPAHCHAGFSPVPAQRGSRRLPRQPRLLGRLRRPREARRACEWSGEVVSRTDGLGDRLHAAMEVHGNSTSRRGPGVLMGRRAMAALLLIGCGRLVDEPEDGATDFDASLVDRVEAGEMSVDGPGDVRDDKKKPAPTPNDAQTACGPAPMWGSFTCCDGGMCRGICANGVCTCAGLFIGCPGDTYCCDGACKSEKECSR
ncbi:hypothetical protein BH09MYX1_BH09MYX1_57820 [soil metagenome]